MRTKSPLVLGPLVALSKSVLNPRQMRTAGTPGRSRRSSATAAAGRDRLRDARGRRRRRRRLPDRPRLREPDAVAAERPRRRRGGAGDRGPDLAGRPARDHPDLDVADRLARSDQFAMRVLGTRDSPSPASRPSRRPTRPISRSARAAAGPRSRGGSSTPRRTCDGEPRDQVAVAELEERREVLGDVLRRCRPAGRSSASADPVAVERRAGTPLRLGPVVADEHASRCRSSARSRPGRARRSRSAGGGPPPCAGRCRSRRPRCSCRRTGRRA